MSNQQEFLFEIGEHIKDEKRDIIILNIFKNADGKKVYTYKCNKCGYIGEGNYDKLKYRGLGCQICCKNPKKIIPELNSVGALYPPLIQYFLNKDDAYKYTPGSSKPIQFKCPICGHIQTNIIYNVTKFGYVCQMCDKVDSRANRLFELLLKSLNTPYKHEWSTDWSNKKRFDFYLYDYNTIVELHGSQHYTETIFGKDCNQNGINDEYKQKLALDNNITNYIVIDCRPTSESIEKLAYEFINNNFMVRTFGKNLPSIEYLTKKYLQMDPLCKECLRLYTQGYTSGASISKKLGYSRVWICKILKELTKIGLINYNSKKAINQYKRKQVKDELTGIIYESVSDCALKNNTSRSAIRQNTKRYTIIENNKE